MIFATGITGGNSPHALHKMDRRDLLKLGAGAAAGLTQIPFMFAQAIGPATEVITRRIPSSGERLPVVGLGTARGFDNPPPDERAVIKEILHRFSEVGGSVIDTAPKLGVGYGEAETLLGELLSEIGNREKLFLATKVNASDKEPGRAQIEQSFQRFKTRRIDLIAVHDLISPDTHLPVLRELKAAGRIRYVGITTSRAWQHPSTVELMKIQALDFIQVDYSILNRDVADRILPLAADRGMAVMINLPLARGRLLSTLQGKPVPEWAKEFDCTSWAQFFLKYVVSHPAVTCAIPGTTKLPHLLDNIGAARGRLPDAAMRIRMQQHVANL